MKIDNEISIILNEIEVLKPDKDYVEIFQLRKRVYEISPMCHQNSLEYIRLLSHDSFKDAILIIKDLLISVEDPANDLRYRLLHSEILKNYKYINEAINVLELAEQLHPHNLFPHVHRAILL